MDREEAQNILQLCRPDNLEDRNDPLIAEALELLKEDAELSTWFDEQQALDKAISAEFEKIEVPADLEASILEGMKAHSVQSFLLEGDEVEDDEDIIPFEPNQKQSALRPWMGIAAIFAIAGVFMALPREQAATQLASNTDTASAAEPVIATAGVPNVIDFLADKITDFKSTGKFDKQAPEVSQLQTHLASMGMPNPAHIPEQLGELETLGCVTFDYEGNNLSMICFKNGQVFHLITAEKANFPKDCTPCEKYKVKSFDCDKQAFRIWSEGDQVFILTTEGSQEDIPELPEFI